MVKKHARMDVWGRAQVVALGAAGWAPKAIRNKVWKPIGSKATSRAVRDILAKAAANPAWRGERGCAEFLVRLRRTVLWMHENLAKELLEMCTNQHTRDNELLDLDGARTQF